MANLRSEKTIIQKLLAEFNDLFLGYGRTIKKLEEYYFLAKQNKPFLQFIKKRRNVYFSRFKKYGKI